LQARQAARVDRIDRIEEWLRALVHHTPGAIDERLRTFAAWSPADWQHLVLDAPLFARLLLNPDQTDLNLRDLTGRKRTQSDLLETDILPLRRLACAVTNAGGTCATGEARLDADLQQLAARAAQAKARGEDRYILRLAVLLHNDLIAWGGTQASTPTRLSVDVTDGRSGGADSDTLQWAIAYGLLDALGDRPTTSTGQPDLWARDWYVATALQMQQSGRSDPLHFDRARRAFPDDPEVRFVSGCQHEVDASPVVQRALRALTASLPRGTTTAIESARSELRAAEDDLRAVVARRADWAEAHLRLGRVLSQLGNRQQAHTHLQQALDGTAADPPLHYLAALFLGSLEEEAGRLDRAAALYERAAERFPSAPSAQLARSQLARRQGDGDAAQRALEPLLRTSDPQGTTDPWWHYLTLQARDAEARLQRLRTSVAAETAP
jgi:tetratricopeptide (TPR) repeat protein